MASPSSSSRPATINMHNRPAFFKAMVDDDFRSTIKIPPSFRKHLSIKINQLRAVVLKNSVGRQWNIKLGLGKGHFFFRDGWEKFIADNRITYGDFLVFFYDATTASFDVIILGVNACVKDPCMQEGKVQAVVISDDSEEDERPATMRKKPKLMKAVDKINNAEKGKAPSSRPYSIVLKGRLKGIDNKKALKAACSFKTPHDHFVTTCRKSRNSYLVYI